MLQPKESVSASSNTQFYQSEILKEESDNPVRTYIRSFQSILTKFYGRVQAPWRDEPSLYLHNSSPFKGECTYAYVLE